MNASYKANKEFVEEGLRRQRSSNILLLHLGALSVSVFSHSGRSSVLNTTARISMDTPSTPALPDCEKEPELADKANIEGYPTVN